ncbi:hypothetical protein TNIN_443611 [Trichonephila inaurata madagascariensis]|uniref:Uncharacterized protein n=1 Tax=Trichonephila inaurata madagascariensis TaxID=2747483 RepID=A0A8X6J3E8_9ARAC|nr:hypothetical protein TNIN_443611 [Trichonephila inaurata madagascariensis]
MAFPQKMASAQINLVPYLRSSLFPRQNISSENLSGFRELSCSTQSFSAEPLFRVILLLSVFKNCPEK